MSIDVTELQSNAVRYLSIREKNSEVQPTISMNINLRKTFALPLITTHRHIWVLGALFRTTSPRNNHRNAVICRNAQPTHVVTPGPLPLASILQKTASSIRHVGFFQGQHLLAPPCRQVKWWCCAHGRGNNSSWQLGILRLDGGKSRWLDGKVKNGSREFRTRIKGPRGDNCFN